MQTIKPKLLNELAGANVEKIIIESLDQSLYRAEVVIEGQAYYLLEAPGKLLSKRNILELQACLAMLVGVPHYLRQHSAYDEMIGQAEKITDNQLLVPLGNTLELTQ